MKIITKKIIFSFPKRTLKKPNPKPDPPCGLQFCLIGKLVLRVTHKDGGQNTGVHQDAFLQSWANKGHKPDWMWR